MTDKLLKIISEAKAWIHKINIILDVVESWLDKIDLDNDDNVDDAIKEKIQSII